MPVGCVMETGLETSCSLSAFGTLQSFGTYSARVYFTSLKDDSVEVTPITMAQHLHPPKEIGGGSISMGELRTSTTPLWATVKAILSLSAMPKPHSITAWYKVPEWTLNSSVAPDTAHLTLTNTIVQNNNYGIYSGITSPGTAGNLILSVINSTIKQNQYGIVFGGPEHFYHL